ncbi:hypothetical protein DPMN_049446 [Dreissena polymorpha]|uniref:Uncharacterized protein n=1 Tax=Dreissena polymorpha TaxID=45954 RepID=A0A9D4CFQ3_DREPO|nr:hypothetical protein DPMN_049446 [Dreissena polymorpha]
MQNSIKVFLVILNKSNIFLLQTLKTIRTDDGHSQQKGNVTKDDGHSQQKGNVTKDDGHSQQKGNVTKDQTQPKGYPQDD